MAEIELKTAPADFRFPTTNQTRHCFTRYIEYHKCLSAKGDDSGQCEKFAKFYRPLSWGMDNAVVYIIENTPCHKEVNSCIIQS